MARRSRIHMHDIVLGGQDGLVNVLGLVLGVAAATSDPKTVIIAGLVGAFAESVSMAAVGYTSTQAEKEYWSGQKKHVMKTCQITLEAYQTPYIDATVVGIASLIGSIIPLWPFFFFSVQSSIYISFASAIATLFVVGSVKGMSNGVKWYKSAVELTVIGTLASLAGYGLGLLLQKL